MANNAGANMKPDGEQTDLWHAYAKQLATYFGYDEHSRKAGARIYSVPLTSNFISVGLSVSEEVRNHDLFRLGDLLLPPNSPVFMPKSSYSQRLLQHLESAQTSEGRKDPVTWTRLNEANQLLSKLTEEFLDCRQKAYSKWQQDPEAKNTSFIDWVDDYFPAYSQTQDQRDGAAHNVDSAADDVFGRQGVQLFKDKRRVRKAFSKTENQYNMPTSARQVTAQEILATASQPDSSNRSVAKVDTTIKFEPRYVLSSNFDTMIANWIATSSQEGRLHPIMTFEYSENKAVEQNVDWSDLGFAGSQVEVPTDMKSKMPLFTASWGATVADQNSPNVVRNLHDQASKAKVTISATDAAVFQISPDTSWDVPDFGNAYPNLRNDAPNSLYESPVRVTNVFLGYQVSVEISTDQSTFDAIDQGLKKANENQGAATLAGIDIGLSVTGADSLQYGEIKRVPDKHAFIIPPRDNTQVTVLGIMGQKLTAPVRAL